jgi:hypothetical protein
MLSNPLKLTLNHAYSPFLSRFYNCLLSFIRTEITNITRQSLLVSTDSIHRWQDCYVVWLVVRVS